jgi:hypothetical protein
VKAEVKTEVKMESDDPPYYYWTYLNWLAL